MSAIHEIQRSWSHEIGGPTMTVTPVAEPYEWLALDLETSNARPEDAERELRMKWKPTGSWVWLPEGAKKRQSWRGEDVEPEWSGHKAETIGSKYQQALRRHQERLALLDSSPVVIVSMRTPGELRLLHQLEARDPEMVEGALVEGFSDERAMLLALRFLLESRCDESTTLTGFNIRGFDLPKLRFAYLRNGLRLPAPLAAEGQPLVDTMRLYTSRFSLSESSYIALADVLEALGMPGYKDLIDGSMVPQLVEAGKVDELIRYALLDAVAEADVFLRLTGRNNDSEPVR